MDLKGLLRDKKMVAALGVGVLGGAYALMRKKGGTSAGALSAGSSGGSAASSGGTAGGYLGSYSDGGAGAYNNIQTSVDNQLSQFAGQLTGLQDQLASIGQSGASQSGTGGTNPNAVLPDAGPVRYTVLPTPPANTPNVGSLTPPSSTPVTPKAKGSTTIKVVPGYTNWDTIAKSTGTPVNVLRQLNGGQLNAIHGTSVTVKY